MILKVFSIQDSATEAFNTPFFMLTKAEAIRAFETMVADPTTQIHKTPLDYHLYYLGNYDNATGIFENDLHNLGSAAVFKQERGSVEELFPAKETSQ